MFITVLAYHLLQFIQHTLTCKGDTRSWFTLRRILQAHCYTTVLMPTKDGTLYRLRRPGQPEAAHEEIYQHFGITTTGLPRSEMVIENEITETL